MVTLLHLLEKRKELVWVQLTTTTTTTQPVTTVNYQQLQNTPIHSYAIKVVPKPVPSVSQANVTT